MITTKQLKEEFYNSCQEHIIEIDHNMNDTFEQEFSFHAICHPIVTEDGIPEVPKTVEKFIKSKAGDYKIEFLDSHIHAYMKIDTDKLYSENTDIIN